MLIAFIIGGISAHAAGSVSQQPSGGYPKAKTENTVKAEKELEKLAAKENTLKRQITASTINRSKLLTQKRAELKEARQKRDAAIKKEIEGIKAKKEKQAQLIRELNTQLASVKKTKQQMAIASVEVSIRIAKFDLGEIDAKLKTADDRLKKSYKDYKSAYDSLAYLDGELKKSLDLAVEVEARIKAQKNDLRDARNGYSRYIKDKDFLAAEKKMESLVTIQSGINANYETVLACRKKFKSDFYEQVLNCRI